MPEFDGRGDMLSVYGRLSLPPHTLYRFKTVSDAYVVFMTCCFSRYGRPNRILLYRTLKEKNGSEVTLTDCRRLWCWYGAASISQLAVEGTKRPNECKFTLVVPIITILGVIEIIPCTEEAVKSIEEVSVWKNR